MFSCSRAARTRGCQAISPGRDDPRVWYAMTLRFDEAGRDPGNQPQGPPFTLNGWYVPPASAGGSGSARVSRVVLPPVDVRIGLDDILLRADMPGIPRENIDIRVQPRYIEIIGMPPEDEDSWGEGHPDLESAYPEPGRARRFTGVAPPREARAKLMDGVLEVKIPRKMVLSGRSRSRIPVR